LKPFQIVIDTSVFIAALRSRRGASFRLLETLGDPAWTANISVALALEYESVGKRVAQELGIAAGVVEDLVDAMCARSRLRGVPFRLRPLLRDADDEFVLELAVASGCDFLVTFNQADFRAAERFGIRVVTPGDFLATIREGV
jgi:putative PIN family toxin of toxin-antitoxin system